MCSHMYIHVYECACLCMYIDRYMLMCSYIYKYTYIYVWTCDICVYMYMFFRCVYVISYVCVYLCATKRLYTLYDSSAPMSMPPIMLLEPKASNMVRREQVESNQEEHAFGLNKKPLEVCGR